MDALATQVTDQAPSPLVGEGEQRGAGIEAWPV